MKKVNVNSAIAGEVMTPYVISLPLDSTFENVINTLHEKNISAVFIRKQLTNRDEYYIISQTDVVSFLKEGGMYHSNLSGVPVSEIMNGPIEMLDVETPIDEIIRFMTKMNYKRVLISEEGKAAGVVSTRDVMMWNDTYFKPARPQILLFMDNINSNFIAKHVFSKNIEDEIRHEIIDLYAGVLISISMITDEIINKSGHMSHLVKEKRSVLFEPYEKITGILICDYNSVTLRRKLVKATRRFYREHSGVIESASEDTGIYQTCDVSNIVNIFR